TSKGKSAFFIMFDIIFCKCIIGDLDDRRLVDVSANSLPNYLRAAGRQAMGVLSAPVLLACHSGACCRYMVRHTEPPSKQLFSCITGQRINWQNPLPLYKNFIPLPFLTKLYINYNRLIL